MSTSNFPTSVDNSSTLPNPTTGSTTNSPSHAALHTTENDAIKALESKVGTGAGTAPAANQILRGTGAGTSDWGQLSSSQWASVLTDETGTGLSVFNNTPTFVTPKVDTINESTTDNGVTVDGLNIKDGVLNSANSVASSNIQTGAVGAANIAANAITLGYAQITSGVTTTSSTYVQVTGLTTTVTIPAGGRKIKITAYIPRVYSTGTAGENRFTIWDGAVGSGTQLSEGQTTAPALSNPFTTVVYAIVTPSAGSKTYNVGFDTGAGTLIIDCSATYPAFILVEAI